MNLKSLAKDTAIYGLSSIVGRFLNYLLVPVYTYKIAAASGGYGIVTNLYAYTALLLAVLTFGMETTLFRFSNKDGEDPRKVYGTSLKMVGAVALLFVAAVLALVRPIAGAMGYADHPEYIGCMAIIVGLDAFQAIMFSKLRIDRRPLKFMALKFAFIIPNILLTLFIFLVMPKMFGAFPGLEAAYQHFNDGVGFIFFANLACTALVTLGFIPELRGLGVKFDWSLAKRMLAYTWPLLLLSLVGNLNQAADKILFPYLMPGAEGMVQLGIYGACVKIAMIVALLTQAFRYAYEPIVFNGSRDKNSPETLADGMKYFVIFALLAYLAVLVYMPLLRHFIQPAYLEGLGVVPIVMMAEVFMGVFQPLVLVQTHRQDLVGRHNERNGGGGDDCRERSAGAQDRLLGLRLGRLCRIRHGHADELDYRPQVLIRAIRRQGNHGFCAACRRNLRGSFAALVDRTRD